MTFNPDTARLAGRIGGLTKASRHPADELTSAARVGFMKRFEPTDPDLDEVERQRRTLCNFKAHMARLAYQSSVARRKRK